MSASVAEAQSPVHAEENEGFVVSTPVVIRGESSDRSAAALVPSNDQGRLHTAVDMNTPASSSLLAPNAFLPSPPGKPDVLHGKQKTCTLC